MAIVLVGGEARKVGKTTLVCALIRAMPERRWTAIKVSGPDHVHALEPGGDTARFLEAGAGSAVLLQGEDWISQLRSVIAGGGDFLVESTRAASMIAADVRLLVMADGKEAKAWSSGFMAHARVKNGRIDDGSDAVEFVRARLDDQP